MSGVHIGKKIREVLDQSPYTVVAFAKSINLSRDSAYKMFAKETIDTGQLKQINIVLKHDFSRYISPDFNELNESTGGYGFVSNDRFESLKKRVEAVEKKLELVLSEKTRPKKKAQGNKS